ncbi:hypothetical protein C8Q76DRAFT_695601 [Earliella scabrosa]|nr:hypothetical protein C8Q76DRAFT_695601 [Earliella scabrosa]
MSTESQEEDVIQVNSSHKPQLRWTGSTDPVYDNHNSVLPHGEIANGPTTGLGRTDHILHLHAEVQGMLADSMDIKTALLWRTVCKATYAEVTGSLTRSRTNILDAYVANGDRLLHTLTEHRAVIGGVAAISFVLRDNIPCEVLQIYVGTNQYSSLVSELSTSPGLLGTIKRKRSATPNQRYARDRDISSITTFHLANGHAVIVYRSRVISACSPMCRSITTALMTFITEHTFACAYDALTLSRRSILSNTRLKNCSETDYIVTLALMRAKFVFTANPTRWPEYRGTEELPPDTFVCLREKYMCPRQGRYFGDRGSLVDFIDPLSPSYDKLRAWNVPPFGPMVAWRIPTTYECQLSCESRDKVLHEWLTSTPIVMLPTPFKDKYLPTRGRERPPPNPLHSISFTPASTRVRSLSL